MTVTRITLALAASIALALPALAETALPPNTFIAAEAPVQYLAKDRLIGAKVKGPDGKIVGDIEDIILSGDHQVVGVIMGTGGFFGLFEKKVGVEVGAIQFDVTDGKIGATLSAATKDVLEAAPAFVRDHAKKSLFERAVEKTQEIRDKTGTSAKDVYEDVKERPRLRSRRLRKRLRKPSITQALRFKKRGTPSKKLSRAPRKRRRTLLIRRRTRRSRLNQRQLPLPLKNLLNLHPHLLLRSLPNRRPRRAEPAPAPAAAEKPPEPAPAPAAEKPANRHLRLRRQLKHQPR